jgi:hypothetical protein
MSQYDELDQRIVAAVSGRRAPLYDHQVREAAERIAAGAGRDAFRVIDGRLKALRKKGTLRYLTKAKAGPGGPHGWCLS